MKKWGGRARERKENEAWLYPRPVHPGCGEKRSARFSKAQPAALAGWMTAARFLVEPEPWAAAQLSPGRRLFRRPGRRPPPTPPTLAASTPPKRRPNRQVPPVRRDLERRQGPRAGGANPQSGRAPCEQGLPDFERREQLHRYRCRLGSRLGGGLGRGGVK